MTLESAQAEFDRAAAELRRQEIVEFLSGQAGLAYRSLSGDSLGPYLVAYNGEIVGEVMTNTPGAVHDWWARLATETAARGPFLTARAAAAALCED